MLVNQFETCLQRTKLTTQSAAHPTISSLTPCCATQPKIAFYKDMVLANDYMNEHHKSPYTDAMNGNKLWENANLF